MPTEVISAKSYQEVEWLTSSQNGNIPAEFTIKEMKTKIVKEFLNIIILLEMTHRESISGYDVIDLVNLKFLEPISPGTVYSTLYNIERKGLIYGETDGRKTVYKLTEKGFNVVDALKKSRNQFAQICIKIYEH